MEQLFGRTFRGQPTVRPVILHALVNQGTFEVVMWSVILDKRSLAESVLNSTGKSGERVGLRRNDAIALIAGKNEGNTMEQPIEIE